MPIDSEHPEYVKRRDSMKMVRDVVEGEDALRRPGNVERYLPPPPGMVVQQGKMKRTVASIIQKRALMAQDRYEMYVTFAEMYELLAEVVGGLQGLIHEGDPVVELPSDMEYLLDRATPSGKTLKKLWQTITSEVLQVGRGVLLGEVVDEINDELGLCFYVAESLINWRMDRDDERAKPELSVLLEHALQPKSDDEYSYDDVCMIRELKMIDGARRSAEEEVVPTSPSESAKYAVRTHKKVKDKTQYEVQKAAGSDASGWVIPQLLGKAFDHIPITVINATDTGFAYGPMPCLPMARVEVSIFRKNADYNRALYNKADPQAWVTGASEDDIPGTIGGSQIWAFTDPQVRLGYLEITGDSLDKMSDAIKSRVERFAQLLAAILSDDGGGVRSGETVRREQSPKKASLRSIVINCAEGMQAALRDLGRLRGKTDDEVAKITFKPYLDFAEPQISADEALKWVQFIMSGGTMSKRTLHKLLRKGNVTDMDYDDELDEMRNEGPPVRIGDPGAYVAGEDDGPGAPPPEPQIDPNAAKPAPAPAAK